MTRYIKRFLSILILLVAFIISGLLVYQNGMGIEEYVSRIENIPIDNQIYSLSDGKSIEQVFTTESSYLAGVELMVVNVLEESTGELVVQLKDMWGDLLKEERIALSSITIGEYYRVTFDTELDTENNEEFQLRIYAESANIPPALICVYETQDVEENSLCYYNDELIESRLVVGYAFGRPKYVGYQYWERAKIQSTVAKTALILLISLVFIYIVNTTKEGVLRKKSVDIKIYYQLTLISIIFSAFFLSVIVNKANTSVKIPFFVYAWLIGTAIMIAGMCFLYIRWLEKEKRYKGKVRLFDPYIWTIVLFVIISRVPMFTQIQKWDGSAYYSGLKVACSQFDFTFASIWNGFRLALHPTFLFTFFCAIGEFLFPARVIGVLVVQLILTIAALICIYCMLRNYWCRMPETPAMLVVLLVSIIPIFWGTFSIVNVDYFLLIFFIFMVYCEYRQLEILRFWWMIALMLTKETGWVIAAGYILICLIMLWRKGGREGYDVKIRRLSKEPLIKIVVLGFMLVCGYVVVQGSVFSWFGVGVEHGLFVSWEEIEERGIGISAVGFYLPYILHKLGQIFILNFMWVPTIIITVSCFWMVRGKVRCKGKIRNLESSIGALVFFILFNIFFVTAALSRYTIFSSVLIWIMAFVMAYYIIIPAVSWKISAGVCVFLALMLCVQNFIYIDPLSNLIFTRLDSGKGVILSTDMNLNGYGDTLINNYRFSYVDKLLDKMLKTVKLSEQMQIIALGEKDTYPISGSGNYELGWDVEKQRRICLDAVDDKDEIIPIHVLSLNELESTEGKIAEPQAVVYFITYCEYDEKSYLNRLEPYYQIGERQEIGNWGGTLSYYLLERIG